MTSVYVIASEGGPVKIGIAADPQTRLRQLSTGAPFQLRLAHVETPADLSARAVEAAAHALLNAARSHGEWFSVSVVEARQAVMTAIADLRLSRDTAPGDPCVYPKSSIKFNNHPLRLWRLDRSKKMTLGELATLAGCFTSHLSEIENGFKSASLRLACCLEEITGLHPRTFLRPSRAQGEHAHG